MKPRARTAASLVLLFLAVSVSIVVPTAAAQRAPSGAAEPADLAALEKALASEDAKVRVHAIIAISKHGAEGLPLLAKAFTNPDEQVRLRAVSFYAQIAGPAGLPALAPMARDDSTRVLHELLRALREWNTPDAISLFLKILKEGPQTFRPYAMSLLEGVSDPQIVPVLAEMARSDPSPLVRSGAYYALSHTKDPAAENQAHVTLLEENDLRIREGALAYVASLGCDKARNSILPALAVAEPMADFRETAVTTLARTCGEAAIPPLLETLRWKGEPGKPAPPTPAMKITLLELLARHPAPSARTQITDLLGDPDATVRRYAVLAMAALGGDSSAGFVRLAKDPAPNVRSTVLDVLGRFPGESSTTALLGALSDPVLDVRLTALRSLGALRDRNATGPLLELLKEKDPLLRSEAILALGGIGDTKALPALLAAAQDADGLVRDAVARALGEMKDPKAIEPLARLARDSDPGIRLTAVRSIGKTGHPLGRQALEAALKDADSLVRAAAREALSTLPAGPTKKP